MAAFRATCDGAAVAEDERERYLAAAAVRAAAASGYHVSPLLAAGGGGAAHYTGPYRLVLDADAAVSDDARYGVTGGARDAVAVAAAGVYRVEARVYVPDHLLGTPCGAHAPSSSASSLAAIADAAAAAGAAAGATAAAGAPVAPRSSRQPALFVHVVPAPGASDGRSRVVSAARGSGGGGGDGSHAVIVLTDVVRLAAGERVRFVLQDVVDAAGDGSAGFLCDLGAARAPPSAAASGHRRAPSDVTLHGHGRGPSAAWLADHDPSKARIASAYVTITAL